MRVIIVALLIGVTSVVLFSCTRPLVTGRDYAMQPIAQTFSVPAVAAFEAAEQALRDMDYKVEYANKDQGILRTGWMPTEIDSHYLDLFGREDYGTTGAYYHLAVRIINEGVGESIVEVAAPIRSVVAKVRSSHRKEKKFLSKVADQLRPADVKVTNIGVVE